MYRSKLQVGGEMEKDTCLEKCKLTLHTIILFVYSCFQEYTATKYFQERKKKRKKKEKKKFFFAIAITDCKNHLRQFCSLLQNSTAIGDTEMTIEVDETFFSYRKCNILNVYPHQWSFGGICRDTKKLILYLRSVQPYSCDVAGNNFGM